MDAAKPGFPAIQADLYIESEHEGCGREYGWHAYPQARPRGAGASPMT
jgi:hypothetical protein